MYKRESHCLMALDLHRLIHKSVVAMAHKATLLFWLQVPYDPVLTAHLPG